MKAQDLCLNIAINLGRISRWAMEGKESRIKHFIADTDFYMTELDSVPKSERFERTYQVFRDKFKRLKNNIELNEEWAEELLTWANILTHRSKLANQY